MAGKKVLVTGGKGFIGSNLVLELRKRGHEVWICDLMHSSEDRHMRCDISKYRQVEKVFERQSFDYVYHAAAEYGRWNGEGRGLRRLRRDNERRCNGQYPHKTDE